MAGPVPKHRQLPDKEAKLFKEVLQYYELKQYKKGIKSADGILKKFPNHGETLALKALTIHSSLPVPMTIGSAPKLEEAEAMARTAVRKDMTSHITWHVLGILAKSRKDWAEASKAFNMARKQDPDNIPLLRDAISLAVHMRNHNQALEARHHLLLLRPQIRQSWLALMVSHEMSGDVDEALHVFDSLQEIIKTDGASGPEKTQIALHVVKMCVDVGKFEEAEQRLEGFIKKGILHPFGETTRLKATILVALGRKEAAEDVLRTLLDQNPDNLEYYRNFLLNKGLDISKPLDAESTERVLSILSSFSETYPRSSAPKRLSLDVASGDGFRDLAQKYVITGLERGVPSLFVDLKGLYRDEGKMRIIGEIVEELVTKLKAETSLHGDETMAPPTALLWAYYFLALHLAHPLNPDPNYTRSLDLINLALEHTPTLPELYMARAMVLKRAGDIQGAAHSMEEARLLDGQDRFLNGKAAKYWFRAGDIKKAEELLAMFTKKDLTVQQDLIDLQCLWFMQEEADSYKNSGNLGMALKRYNNIFQTFQDYEDDQYDFHGYAMRRMTFNTHISLMKYEDQIRSHPRYAKAALGAIEIYIKIADDPSLTVEKLSAEEEAERKKAAKKAQKAEQKAKKAAAASGDSKKDEAPIPDDDPTGQKLLKSETPIDDAIKIWLPLEQHRQGDIDTWLAGYELFVRKKQYIRALKCLRFAASIQKEHGALHRQLVQFRQITSSAEMKDLIKSAIDQGLEPLVPSISELKSFNETYLSTHPSSPPQILASAQSLAFLASSSSTSIAYPSLTPSEITPILTVLEKLTVPSTPPDLEAMRGAIELLEKIGAGAEMVEGFKRKCKERVPLAWVFATKEEKEKRKFEGSEENKEIPNGNANANGKEADV